MKKVIVFSMISLTVLSTFVIFAPRQVSASSSWTIKQLTKNDVDDVITVFALSRDGNRIVFDRRPSSPSDWDIYAMNTTDEPGQEKQMTTTYGRDVGSGISGDGSKIAFNSGRFHPDDPWYLEIFVMNFTDSPGQEVQVSDNSTYLDGDFTLSGDGEIIAWHSGPASTGPLDILVKNMTDQSLLSINVGEWDEYPSISYDGRKISFISDGDVYLVNSDGTGLRQITNTPERESRHPLISGDGTKIAFTRQVGNCEIFVYDIVNNITTQLTNNGVDDWLGSINYDGSIVAYDREGRIFIHNMTHETQLTDGTFQDDTPRLDGDGDTIAFRSRGRDGSDAEIFVMHAPLVVNATVDIDPDTLNLKSNGEWVTAYITLPEDYLIEDIDVTTVELRHDDFVLAADWGDVQEGVLMVKFDRIALRDYLGEADLSDGDKFYDITLTATGELVDGTPFEGSDTITVIRK